MLDIWHTESLKKGVLKPQPIPKYPLEPAAAAHK